MSEFPQSGGQRSQSSFNSNKPAFPHSVDRSRSARCSPSLRRRRMAHNHCSPRDRLRLIQFLQDIDLDKALHSLPDEFTLEDLLQFSFDVVKETFQDTLDTNELGKLAEAIYKHANCSSPRSPGPSYRSRRVSPFLLETCFI